MLLKKNWATVPLEERGTVNSEWYTTICLTDVFGEIKKLTSAFGSFFIKTMLALRYLVK